MAPWISGHAETVRLQAVERVADHRATPPGREVSWQRQTLPDDWSTLGSATSAWYRLPIPAGLAEQPLPAIYLGSVIMNAEVWTGSGKIASGGSMAPPMAQNWNRALLMPLPAAALTGEPYLYLNVRRIQDCFGYLGDVRLGSMAALEPLARAQNRLRIGVASASTWIGLLLGLILLALFWSSRKAMHIWGAATCLCLSVASLNYHMQAIPVASFVWERMAMFSSIWGLLAAYALGRTFLPEAALSGCRSLRWCDHLARVLAAGSLLVLLLPHQVFHEVTNGLFIGFVVLAAWLWGLLLYWRPGRARWTVLLFAIVGGGLFIPEVGRQLGWIDVGTISLAPLTGIVLAAAFVALIGIEHLRSHRRVQQLNSTLAQRVDRAVTELRRRETEVATMRERERLARELHDGLGGQLVSTLSLAEEQAPGEEIADHLRYALMDLRLIVNASATEGVSLSAHFGRIRPLLQRLVAGKRLSLHWRIGELPDLPWLASEGLLDVTRILQEAVTNATRHACADNLWVSARVLGNRVEVSVEDDGGGTEGAVGGGFGLDNMRRRAGRLGGTLSLTRRIPAGTRVTLSLPVSVPQTGDGADAPASSD